MVPMLSKNSLDNLWKSGFCKTLIERIRYTEKGDAGYSMRVQLMEDHLKEGCVDCANAHTMRDVEMRTATVMGNEALAQYNRGESIHSLPEFALAFKQVFNAGVQCGRIKPTLGLWIAKTVALRAGHPYPYTEDKDAPKAN